MRLEKRVQTLITLGGDVVASTAAQQETTAADAPAKVQMRRDSNSGVTSWSVEEGALNRELGSQDPLQSLEPDESGSKTEEVEQDKQGSTANTNELNDKIGSPDED